MAKRKALQMRPIKDKIIFIFEDEGAIHNGVRQFKERTESGIEVVCTSMGLESARWGVVIACGPDIKDKAIELGKRILIDKLKWTEGFFFDGNMFWQTDEPSVLAVDES